MSTIINADTSDGLKFTSDTSGEIKLQSAGADIATVNSSGITMASGKAISGGEIIQNAGPAFSAIKSGAGNQSISASTLTKVTFPNEQWDLTSDYDTATSRFTPSVSGYYQFNSSFYFLAPVDGGVTQIQLYKNGSAIKYGNILTAAGTQSHSPLLSATVYANGTTDYFEIYIWQNSGTKNIDQSATLTWFDGILIQQA